MSVFPITIVNGNLLTVFSFPRAGDPLVFQIHLEKVEAVYFQVSDLGGVTFAMSQEDMEHSRIFFSRYYGADTVYNLSGYEKMISSIYIESGRSVWYSPVLWQVTPDGLDGMTDEECFAMAAMTRLRLLPSTVAGKVYAPPSST